MHQVGPMIWYYLEALPETHPARVEPLCKFRVEWRPNAETSRNWSMVMNGRLTFNGLSLEMRRNNTFRAPADLIEAQTAMPPGQTVREG